MITPAEAKAKLKKKRNDAKAEKIAAEKTMREKCQIYFDKNEDFRTHVEEKIEEGINRAIRADGRPLYVLVNDSNGPREADFNGVRLSWWDKYSKWHEAHGVCTTSINLSNVYVTGDKVAGNMSRVIEEYLKKRGWKTKRCDTDYEGFVFLYLAGGSSPDYGKYSVFQLCYE